MIRVRLYGVLKQEAYPFPVKISARVPFPRVIRTDLPSILYPTVIPAQRGILNKDQLPRDTYYRLNDDEPMFQHFVTQVSTPPCVKKKKKNTVRVIPNRTIRDSISHRYRLNNYRY